MITFFLPLKPSSVRPKRSVILTHIRSVIGRDFDHVIHPVDMFIDNDVLGTVSGKDVCIFHPLVAHDNLDTIKLLKNKVVVLEKPTILVQKESRQFNPFNENKALIHDMMVLYINPGMLDITNDEYKIVANRENFILSNDDFRNYVESRGVVTVNGGIVEPGRINEFSLASARANLPNIISDDRRK
jgi:hypothetical protein